MTAYDAICFDNDGVLVTPPSDDTQAATTLDAFAAVGATDVDDSTVAAIVDGPTADQIREICRELGLETNRFWSTWERYDDRVQRRQFEAGRRDAYDDVAVLGDLSGPVGVVSNNHHTTVEYVIERFGLAPWVDTYYGREPTLESLDRQKPNTHYLERALTDLEVDPGEGSVLYVGDSEGDVVAAHRAEMDSAFVRRPHCRDLRLSVEPTYELAGLEELVGILEFE